MQHSIPLMAEKYETRPDQSVELLKHLHILTRDGRLNQDSRRKLKQVRHLLQFITPLVEAARQRNADVQLVDIGAGKSCLGFLLYDEVFSKLGDGAAVTGVENRSELVAQSRRLAERCGFERMRFFAIDAAAADAVLDAAGLPARIDIVTALHACDVATDDAIRFALQREAAAIVVAPCCQAEVAAVLRRRKAASLADPLAELWRHPLHTREFGSHITNVLRCLQLQAHGYAVQVTELVGWEHSLKNELIIAKRENRPGRSAGQRLTALLQRLGLDELQPRFFLPQ